MAISGIGNNYSNVYGSTYTAQKNETVKKTETKEAAPAQAKNTGQTVYRIIIPTCRRIKREERAEGTGGRTVGKDSDIGAAGDCHIGCIP